ncbi:hypothetical protein BTVI_74540 [Pitangus sulphuratus]|nr:hypothetical protein BTVI_74540 [Pitangus sulphuratus]
MPAGSKMDLPLASAEPNSDHGKEISCHYAEEEEEDAIPREALLAAEVCAPDFTSQIRPGKRVTDLDQNYLALNMSILETIAY